MREKGRPFMALGLLLAGVIVCALPYHVAVTGAVLIGCGAVLLAAEWIQRKWGKPRLARWLTTGTAAGVLLLAVLCCAVAWHSAGDDPARIDADFVVVLGAQIQGDRPSRTLRERLDLAAEYLQAHPGAVAYVSGGQGPDESLTEAEVMDRYLRQQGIDERQIVQEDQAGNTRENLLFSRTMAEKAGISTDKVLIITSEYHLPRARYIAGTLGMEAYGLASKTTPWILRVNYYLREVFAFVKAAAVAASAA